MISSALSCLNSGGRLPCTRAAALRNVARRSLRTFVANGVMMILLPSRLNSTSLPAVTPAAVRMCLGMVTWPYSVTSIAELPSVGIESKNSAAPRWMRNITVRHVWPARRACAQTEQRGPCGPRV